MDYEPALPLISVLCHGPEQARRAFEKLNGLWEGFVVSAPSFLFDISRYYESEMGYPLYRWWCWRNKLADPSKLIEWKHNCTEIEQELAREDGSRTVNLDPGYLNYALVVLGSYKYDLQKIYLGDKVYADPVLRFDDGGYHPFDWSFPDFKINNYYSRLEKIRLIYKALR